jgi:hypothetical protein
MSQTDLVGIGLCPNNSDTFLSLANLHQDIQQGHYYQILADILSTPLDLFPTDNFKAGFTFNGILNRLSV